MVIIRKVIAKCHASVLIHAIHRGPLPRKQQNNVKTLLLTILAIDLKTLLTISSYKQHSTTNLKDNKKIVIHLPAELVGKTRLS